MAKLVSFILGTVGVVFVIISGILLSMYPVLLQSMVKKQLVLKEGTDFFEKWSSVNVPIYTKIYFFDVQNPDEVEMNGSSPIVTERGPYTFLQKIRKEIIGFENSKQLISYKDFKTYHFLREKSVGGLDDEITVVNIPVVAGIDGAVKESETSDLGEGIIDLVSGIIRELGETLFEVRSVDEFLFTGYRVTLLDRMEQVAKEFGLHVPEYLPNNTFGLMIGKNDSDSGIMTIYTGSDGTDIFHVDSWDMAKQVSFWNGSICNMINGTDGTGFGPGITRNSILYSFQPDFCRSAQLRFDSDSEVEGIKTLRFVSSESNFRAPTASSSESCFCTQREGRREGICDVNGLLDVSTCSDGAPIALSPAHFLGGDTHLTEDVEGLRPSPNKHQMFLDIEPITGSVLAAARRLQINVVLRNHPAFEIVSNIKESTILPVLWIEETVEITESMAMEMKKNLFSKIVLVKTVLKSFLVIGIVILFIAIVIITLFHAKKTAPVNNPTSGGQVNPKTRLNNDSSSSKIITPRVLRIIRKN